MIQFPLHIQMDEMTIKLDIKEIAFNFENICTIYGWIFTKIKLPSRQLSVF